MDVTVKVSESERDILRALDEICASEYFSEAEQIRKFLRYVVDEALAGRADRIKSYSVAVEALGKDADFDPTQDPIVRITANRLRSALAKYYNETPNQHRVVIRLPKGHYIPEFDFHQPAAAVPAQPPVPVAQTGAARRLGNLRHWVAIFATSIVVLVAALFAWTLLHAADARAELGRVWVIVQDLETGSVEDDDFGRLLGDQLIAQMTRYDGIGIIDASRSPNQERSASQVAGNGWTEQHVYSLTTYVRMDEGYAGVRWYLTDMHTNQVMWASDRRVSFEAGDGANAIVQAIAAEMLGLEGAIPVILDRVQSAGLDDDEACLAKAQRNAFSDDIMLLDNFASCLERVVQNHPRNGQAWALLSLAYNRQGRFAASRGEDATAFRALQRQAAQRATMISPETFFPHLAQLAAAYDAGQTAVVENLADRMLLRYSGDPRLKVTIGKALVSLGQTERGLPLIEAGLQQIPSLGPLGYTMLALERYVVGDLEGAIDYLNAQALPDDYRYWLMKAVIHAGADQPDPARQAWKVLLQLRPGYGENVCDDLRHANLHHTYYTRIVTDLSDVVDDLPLEACGVPAVASSPLTPDPGGRRTAGFGGQ